MWSALALRRADDLLKTATLQLSPPSRRARRLQFPIRLFPLLLQSSNSTTAPLFCHWDVMATDMAALSLFNRGGRDADAATVIRHAKGEAAIRQVATWQGRG